jgi:hypothetical protein
LQRRTSLCLLLPIFAWIDLLPSQKTNGKLGIHFSIRDFKRWISQLYFNKIWVMIRSYIISMNGISISFEIWPYVTCSSKIYLILVHQTTIHLLHMTIPWKL